MTAAKALRLFLALTFVTGAIYPLGMTLTARLLFPDRAGGGIVSINGVPIGSALLAQRFESRRYFHPRPSTCDFETAPSGASNQGPTSAALRRVVLERAADLRAAHALPAGAPIPPDLLLASGSGLDPHISSEAMEFQMGRVAEARGLMGERRALMERACRSLVEPPQWGFLGEARVNVLLLNIALDTL